GDGAGARRARPSPGYVGLHPPPHADRLRTIRSHAQQAGEPQTVAPCACSLTLRSSCYTCRILLCILWPPSPNSIIGSTIPITWRMITVPLLIVAASLDVSPISAQGDDDFTLTILHTNDTHSHIEEYDGSTTTCPAESGAAGLCIGGVARRATLIADLRTSAP